MARMQEDRNALSQQLAAATARAVEAETQAAQVRQRGMPCWPGLQLLLGQSSCGGVQKGWVRAAAIFAKAGKNGLWQQRWPGLP